MSLYFEYLIYLYDQLFTNHDSLEIVARAAFDPLVILGACSIVCGVMCYQGWYVVRLACRLQYFTRQQQTSVLSTQANNSNQQQPEQLLTCANNNNCNYNNNHHHNYNFSSSSSNNNYNPYNLIRQMAALLSQLVLPQLESLAL